MSSDDPKLAHGADEPAWLDDPDAPPSPEEAAAAEALARALEGDDSPLENDASAAADRAFAAALKASYAPVDLPPARHDRLVEAAIERAAPHAKKAPGEVIALRFRRAYAVVGVLAAAACLALVLGKPKHGAPASQASAPAARAEATSSVAAASTALVPCRSTQDLFDAPFPREGGASARVDKIAAARGRDLRENRFARWGVR